MNDERAEYTRRLEESLKKFLQPMKEIPFPVVIEALTGCRVQKFISGEQPTILELLKMASAQAGQEAAGYPDIEIHHKSGWVAYLDCKTFASSSIGSAFRAFYLSPSAEPKITNSASHLLLSFELRRKGSNTYIPLSWHLYDLFGLALQVKHEFNASNRDIYGPELLLAEAQV